MGGRVHAGRDWEENGGNTTLYSSLHSTGTAGIDKRGVYKMSDLLLYKVGRQCDFYVASVSTK